MLHSCRESPDRPTQLAHEMPLSGVHYCEPTRVSLTPTSPLPDLGEYGRECERRIGTTQRSTSPDVGDRDHAPRTPSVSRETFTNPRGI